MDDVCGVLPAAAVRLPRSAEALPAAGSSLALCIDGFGGRLCTGARILPAAGQIGEPCSRGCLRRRHSDKPCSRCGRETALPQRPCGRAAIGFFDGMHSVFHFSFLLQIERENRSAPAAVFGERFRLQKHTPQAKRRG